MKDYYKILGIKPTAFPEDIHGRWIELMRKFHPDTGKDGGAEEERVREINEAYAVLKHPSARAHYDLERTYYRKKSNLYLQRLLVPPIILIVLIILGLIYLRKPWGTPQPESTFPSARASITSVLNDLNVPNQINETDQIDEMAVTRAAISNILNDRNDPNALNVTNDLNEPNEISQTNQTDEMDERNEIDEINETKLSPLVIKVKPSRKKRKVVTSSNQRKVTKTSNVPNQKNQIDQTLVVKAKTPANLHKPVASRTRSKPRTRITKINEINQTNRSNQINQIDKTNQMNQFSQLTPPSLIATEQEVKQFFSQYRERYNRKDIEGLLSLFSSRAVQNGRDGFDEIKKIYSNFFDQSQKLRYYIEDMGIQIYQNAVEVQGRYKIDQTTKGGRKKKVWRGDIRWILLRENGSLKIRFLDFRPQE